MIQTKSSSFDADIAAIAAIAAVPTILDVVCRTTGMGFAAVARVTEDRWIACGVLDNIQFGLTPGSELKVETTICHEIRASHEPVVIDHVALDPRFASHHTPAMYGFQSYISMPIILPDGSFFGTLCAIDPRPMQINTPETIGMFKLFADLIAFHLDAHGRLVRSTADIAAERLAGDLREQFIAVLGHDLRSPLSSIGAGVRLLQREPDRADAGKLTDLIMKSVERMASIIDDVLDLARGRLGQGMSLPHLEIVAVTPLIEHVAAELRSVHPDHVIDLDLAPDLQARCDGSRLGQLVSNLIANALTHGAPDKPVRVAAESCAGTFTLAVINQGTPIPAEIQADLFKPFFRDKQARHQGLGLGLYIAAEIARAHHGTLTVTSTADETRFTFRMPAL
jgi:signal transduction histidine kinase